MSSLRGCSCWRRRRWRVYVRSWREEVRTKIVLHLLPFILKKPLKWNPPSGQLAGTGIGSAARMMISVMCWVQRKMTKDRIFIEPQGMCVMADLGVEDGRAEKALNSVVSILPRRTALFCSSLLSANIICIWARSHPTRLAIRKTRASSVTPTRGS